jgi:branched-chain amino acid transport system ATP-binding protein
VSVKATSTPVLEARGITSGYGAIPAIRDVSVSVERGEILALLGPNGAGKTTTLLTLCGELAPMAGEVRLLGKPAPGSLTQMARSGLALVTEERSVFMGLTVRENLRLGRGDQERALELFPMLTEHLHRRAGLLSGGQQQILTLARALAAEPRVLLADELSLGLAPIVVQQLLRAIREAADTRGLAVVLVEQHIRDALKVADRICVLQRGRCVLAGMASEMVGRIDEIENSYLQGPAELDRDPGNE